MSDMAKGLTLKERLEHEIERLRQERDDLRSEREEMKQALLVAEQERDEYKAALEAKYNVKTDVPIFKGLVGGTFPPGALLATCHRLQGELDAVAEDEWDKLKQQRDEAREAARYLLDCQHSEFSENKWPWLEDTHDD